MLTQTKIAFLISALVAGTTFANSAAATLVVDQPIAREASEGARGEGARGEGGKKGGHRAIEVQDQLAREASEGARGEGGKKGGHRAIEVQDQLARNGADDRQPDDRGGRRGGRGGRA